MRHFYFADLLEALLKLNIHLVYIRTFRLDDGDAIVSPLEGREVVL